MSFFDSITTLLKASIMGDKKVKELSLKFEKDVVGKSFDVKKIPKTSKYYEAYYIGFLQGGQTARKSGSAEGLLQLFIEEMIERKQEEEKMRASVAVDGPPGVAIPVNKCDCGYSFNCSAALGKEDHTPGDGDVSLCAKCAQIWIFNKDGTVRRPTAEEEAKISADPHIIQVRAAIKELRQKA